MLAAKKSFLQARESGEEVILYHSQDQGGSSEKVTVEVHNSSRESISPPPKPQKQKIHLKQNSSVERRNTPRENGRQEGRKKDDNSRDRKRDKSRGQDKEGPRGRDRSRGGRDDNISKREAAVLQELKDKVSDKQGKISKFSHRRNNNGSGHADKSEGSRRKEGGKLREGGDDGSPRPSHLLNTKSRAYESVTGSGRSQQRGEPRINRQKSDIQGLRSNPRGTRKELRPDLDYRRSRSMGPVGPRLESPDSREDRRSRSRGRRGDRGDDVEDGVRGSRSAQRPRLLARMLNETEQQQAATQRYLSCAHTKERATL